MSWPQQRQAQGRQVPLPCQSCRLFMRPSLLVTEEVPGKIIIYGVL